MRGCVHLAVQLGMLPSEFMSRATSLDVGLLEEYYAAIDAAREKARQDGDLMSAADANAADARRSV